MAALRTADERFTGLPDWTYAPLYTEHAGYRVHYIDEGPRDAAVTALCLHGNPSWSYLYRYMIPVFTAAGLRVVAPDLIGFGRSDKPVDAATHTWDLHRDMLLAFVTKRDLKNVMLVCQDWGGLLGMTLPHVMPERFKRLLVMNTGLGLGTLTEGFRAWRSYSNTQADLPAGKVIARGRAQMTPAEVAAYDAPFPDASYKAALRAFPNLVPDVTRDGPYSPGVAVSREAAAFWSQRWNGQSFMAIGMQDPVLGPPAMRALHGLIRGCPPPLEVAQGGHFVQEWGAPIAQAALVEFGLLQRAAAAAAP